ncbi:S9 family peptidase [Aliiglaciecola litoralis]|uniref:S9 family peptidase n=1 Tax=Aliiglaciecola litoralis TaxID=582857 RepID=A0ABN1LDW7_9ALTE
MKKFVVPLITCIAALLHFQVSAQESLTIERIFQSPALDGAAPKKLKVSPDGKRVTFLKGKESDYERYDLWEYDVASGKTSKLFDSNDLMTGNEQLSDEEKARRERMRESGTGIIDYFWSNDGTALLFPLGGDAYYLKLGDKKARQLLNTDAFETDIKFSPQGNYISYVREQNLYIMHIASGKEQAITTKGGGNIKYAMAEFVAQEEMSRMTGYWWSPDESHIALTRVDMSPVEMVTRSEIYADSIKMVTQRYPLAGTANVDIGLGVYHFKSQKIDWIDLGEEKDMYLARAKWMPDSLTLTYQWQSRNQQLLELRAYNAQTGKQQVLITESSNTWVNLHDDLYFLNEGEQILWASERDGFKHLYLFDKQGKMLKQLTKGDWVVDDVEAIDTLNQQVFFTGRKDTPIEKQLYKVSLNGGKVDKVSLRKGFHEVTFSDDSTIYVDRFSTFNTPWQVSLHDQQGKRLTWLEQNQIDASHPLNTYQSQWVNPEFGTFDTPDGAQLHYRLFKPKKITGKHPAIVFVYGGPHAQVVQDKWYGNRGLLMQHWVNKGYVVFSVDNRGSNYRGKAFEEPLYQKMGSIEVDDQVAGAKFLASLGYVDEKRIGIHGHSYGGYMTLMAMFKAGDTFSAGVSGAPVTDWQLYDTHYTERYMGNPTLVPEAYTAASVFPYAKDLKNPLLIYHGMADDNVLFKHSTKLYKHLQDMAITFETMDYPGKKHSIRGKNTGIHLYKTITQFFDRTIGRP